MLLLCRKTALWFCLSWWSVFMRVKETGKIQCCLKVCVFVCFTPYVQLWKQWPLLGSSPNILSPLSLPFALPFSLTVRLTCSGHPPQKNTAGFTAMTLFLVTINILLQSHTMGFIINSLLYLRSRNFSGKWSVVWFIDYNQNQQFVHRFV